MALKDGRGLRLLAYSSHLLWKQRFLFDAGRTQVRLCVYNKAEITRERRGFMKGQTVIPPTAKVSFRCPLCYRKGEISLTDRLHKDAYVCPSCKQTIRSADIHFEVPDLSDMPPEIRDTVKY